MKNFSNINENLDITTKEYVDNAVASNKITSINGLTGGTVNGNITLKKELVFTDTTNPYIKMVTGGNTYYFQSSGGQFSLGPTWDLATKWSSDGGVQFPLRPKVNLGTVAEPNLQEVIVQSDIPDVSGKANLTGGNNWTGTQVMTSPDSTSYSINATGYLKGSWLQSTTMQNKGSNTGKICVFDNNGWIYYRTPAEILSEAGGAKLTGINNFTGTNTFTNNNVFFTSQSGQTTINGSDVSIRAVGAMGSAELSVKTDNNNKVFEVISDAESGAIHLNSMINIDNEQQGNVPLCIGGTNAGVSGQVLTSQGDNATPIWSTPVISAANLVGSTLYLTINSTAAQTSDSVNAAVYNDIY